MVLLVLWVQIHAHLARPAPQYIPMPDMATCETIAPLIIADMATGLEVTVGTGVFSQKPGEPMVEGTKKAHIRGVEVVGWKCAETIN